MSALCPSARARLPESRRVKGAPMRHRCAATVRRASPLVSLPSRRSGRAGFRLSAMPTDGTTSVVFCNTVAPEGLPRYAIPGALGAPDLPARDRAGMPSPVAAGRAEGRRSAVPPGLPTSAAFRTTAVPRGRRRTPCRALGAPDLPPETGRRACPPQARAGARHRPFRGRQNPPGWRARRGGRKGRAALAYARSVYTNASLADPPRGRISADVYIREKARKGAFSA